MNPGLRVERLAAHHDLSNFDSDDHELDAWLQRHALPAQQMDTARTFLAVDDDRIVGYFSLTMEAVRRADAPRRLAIMRWTDLCSARAAPAGARRRFPLSRAGCQLTALARYSAELTIWSTTCSSVAPPASSDWK